MLQAKPTKKQATGEPKKQKVPIVPVCFAFLSQQAQLYRCIHVIAPDSCVSWPSRATIASLCKPVYCCIALHGTQLFTLVEQTMPSGLHDT